MVSKQTFFLFLLLPRVDVSRLACFLALFFGLSVDLKQVTFLDISRQKACRQAHYIFCCLLCYIHSQFSRVLRRSGSTAFYTVGLRFFFQSRIIHLKTFSNFWIHFVLLNFTQQEFVLFLRLRLRINLFISTGKFNEICFIDNSMSVLFPASKL